LIVDREHPQFKCVFTDWRRHPSLWPLLSRIEKRVSLRLTLTSEAVVLTDDQRKLYRLFVSYLWEMMRRADKHRLHLRVSEPKVGNPIRVWRVGRLITQDLANSIIECNLVADLLKEEESKDRRVAEIGAGYGRLAHVFSTTQPGGTYYVFDIPPALYISQWYLTRVLPGKRIFDFRRFNQFEDVREEMEQSDVVILSANQIREFPPAYFDVIVSISTLPEMRPEQVKLYLDLFGSLSRRHVYLKQWKNWKNPLDGTDMRIEDYDLGEAWETVLDRTDPINPEFFNRVWRRRA
jgi:putative sugar O-methyltransferase